MKRVFVLDDDPSMIALAKKLLEDIGCVVAFETDPVKGLKRILENPPELLLLDCRMPKMDGIEVCKALRASPKTQGLAIIMVSSRVSEADVVAGLEVGADDYVCKPFREREMQARVKSATRRHAASAAEAAKPEMERFEEGPLSLDADRYAVTLDGKNLQLAPKEFQLLSFFLRNQGRVLTRSKISESVWHHEHDPKMRTIDRHVDLLRKKLGRYGVWIEGIRGIGYRFEVNDVPG